jgi:hypothetical protein
MQTDLETYAEKLSKEHKEFVIFIDYKEKPLDKEIIEYNLFSYDLDELPLYSLNIEDYDNDIKKLEIDILPGFLFFDIEGNLNILDILDMPE